MKNILKITFVIIGTLVGAGFASGKEIYSFFFIYGKTGIIGIFLSSLIIGLIIYKVIKRCEDYKIDNYQNFCDSIEKSILKNNRKNTISKLFNYFVNIFLLIMFYVMIAGFSSFLLQEFNINKTIGSIVILVLCYFTFVGNMNELMKVSNYLIPFLIIFIVYISGKNIIAGNFDNYIELKYIYDLNDKNSFEFMGIIKSILYASYNCIILIPVLVQLNTSLKEKQKNKLLISAISAFIICSLSFAVYNLLLQGDFELFKLDMPIIAIAKQFGKLYGLIYTVIIGVAIFTSAASSGVRIFK